MSSWLGYPARNSPSVPRSIHQPATLPGHHVEFCRVTRQNHASKRIFVPGTRPFESVDVRLARVARGQVPSPRRSTTGCPARLFPSRASRDRVSRTWKRHDGVPRAGRPRKPATVPFSGRVPRSQEPTKETERHQLVPSRKRGWGPARSGARRRADVGRGAPARSLQPVIGEGPREAGRGLLETPGKSRRGEGLRQTLLQRPGAIKRGKAAGRRSPRQRSSRP
jgi:hypothetical protein